ncbi:MAG TPA: dihydrofolate reductase [Cryomorphaceae bacterium]|nr:dihydrofolate reductase [Cryomorphaceae bacterium]|tara:strand:- start:402 stop:929 length:528 start_codon:yes stop_codon:yes gene_type:complete
MITLYTAVTLDGYIATTDGNVDFLENPRYQLPDEDYGYAGFYEGIDVVTMGYNTYKQVINFEGEYPYQGKHSIVFSRADTTEATEGDIQITTESENTVIQRLKRENKNVWIIGGGATNARMHQSGLVDRMILTYLPITLGAGIPLFRENKASLEWKNVGTRTFSNGLVQITLERR